ncbi:MAG TPA: CBS domain-containing protein [Bacillota bacterium]|nr:CBS domain-containing protein [Bacillota bacterium]
MKVKHFMITDVICVTKETTVKRLLETLVTHKIGGVPVVDDENTLIGMITDGDVLRYLQPKGRGIYDMYSLVIFSEKENLDQKLNYALNHHVDRVMRKKDIKRVRPDDDLEEALAIFSRHHFKKIPVVNDERKVVGVLSRGDMIRYITTQLIE